MRNFKRPAIGAAGAAVLACGAFVAAGGAVTTPATLTSVPSAQPATAGLTSPDVLSPQLYGTVVAQGSIPVENPQDHVKYYGYLDDGPLLPAFGSNVEASKTEPDKNTYLNLPGQHGADAGYDYGTHYLYQGHEAGKVAGVGQGSITRVNLDADYAHKVTVLATKDTGGNPLPNFDGSTWDPFANRLLMSFENGNGGGIWQATPDYPSTVDNLSAIFGRGGFEGEQTDNAGNVWIVEDSGGPAGAVNNKAKQPNSFLYRFKPADKADLTAGGKMQALQVISLRNNQPIVFHPGAADADITSQDTADLHTYGHTFKTKWVSVHDTATDGTTPYDANALAKAAGATPFKRPENGQFKPGTNFREFFFSETGDTNAASQANAGFGGWGGVQHLKQMSASADTGQLSLFYQSDATHTAFDNVTFLSASKVAFVEDRGAGLHNSLNALDSGWVFDTAVDYADPSAPAPVRMIAQGRDPSATIDAPLVGTAGFQNEDDNEITGIHASDGDPGPFGLLGAKVPKLFMATSAHWRLFYTGQHGENKTWEVKAR